MLLEHDATQWYPRHPRPPRGPAQALPGVPDGRRERERGALEAGRGHLHARPHHHEVPHVLREPRPPGSAGVEGFPTKDGRRNTLQKGLKKP